VWAIIGCVVICFGAVGREEEIVDREEIVGFSSPPHPVQGMNIGMVI
jgi:hypothetical protein